MAQQNTTENHDESDNLVEDSLDSLEGLPLYDKNVDRSRSLLDSSNFPQRSHNDRLLNVLLRRTIQQTTKDLDVKEVTSSSTGRSDSSTPKRNHKGLSSTLNISPILPLSRDAFVKNNQEYLSEYAEVTVDPTPSDVSSLKSFSIEEETSGEKNTEELSLVKTRRRAYIESSSSFDIDDCASEVNSSDLAESLDDSNSAYKDFGTETSPSTCTHNPQEPLHSDSSSGSSLVTADSNSVQSSVSIIVLDSSTDNTTNSQKAANPQIKSNEEVKPNTLDSYIVKGNANREPPKIVEPPKLNPEEYNRLVCAKPVQRLLGGKMTTDRFRVVYAVTGDTISEMHKSIANAPSENDRIPTPKGLVTELLDHQRQGLAWMLWREKQRPPGGILADDMGLGKTLSFIALIVEQMNRSINESEEDLKLKVRTICANFLVPSNSTLVIVPASLIYQWDAEIKKHVKSGLLDVYIYHGPKQKRESDPKRLSRYNIVLTTYNTVVSELADKKVLYGSSDEDNYNFNGDALSGTQQKRRGKCSVYDSVLTKIAWSRIILDEAHQIKNKSSLVSKACSRLPGICRWCSSGTPVHNKLWDLFSLIRFLRVRPFDEEAVWKEYIMHSSSMSSERLNTLVKGLLLRREKTDVNASTNRPIIELKEKKHEDVLLQLCGLEKKVYDFMFLASRRKVREIMEQNGIGERHCKSYNNAKIRNPFIGGIREINLHDNFQAMSSVLTLLLRLRQACVHMALTKNAIDLGAFEDLDSGCIGSDDIQLSNLTNSMANLSVVDPETVEKDFFKKEKCDVSALFDRSYNSTKIQALMKRLNLILEETDDKCVIVSQWTSLLEIVEQRLVERDVNYVCITGKVLPKNRQPCVDSFNRSDGGAKVMLLSLTAGGVGLNLVGGNHLFLLDLHWNPALEQQACDRIYRMGQKKNVFIHKFICNETIEQRVLNLQDSKKALAKSVLEGAASKKLSKLTLNDIKFLFDLNSLRKPTLPKSAMNTEMVGQKVNGSIAISRKMQ